WVGTQKGLVCLRRDEKGVYKIVNWPNFPTGVAYTCMANNANESELYFGTNDGRICRINRDSTIAIQNLSQSAIHALRFNRTQTKLFATTAGGELFAMEFVHP